jgi:glucose-6-phosphate-specific signal transduction histidine kinase
MIAIEDDGRGFAEGVADGSRRGLGLIGLRERVTEQHGQVEIDSAPGGGTRVVVTLPACRPPAVDAGGGRAVHAGAGAEALARVSRG